MTATANRLDAILGSATKPRRTVAQILATARVVAAPVDPLALASRIEAMTVRATKKPDARDLASRIEALAVKAGAKFGNHNAAHPLPERTAADDLAPDHIGDANKMVRHAHDRARAAAEAIYLAAMLAAAAKLKGEKDKRTRDAAILLLLLLAGEEAYAKTYAALEKAAPTAPEAGQPPTPPVSADTLEAEAASFAATRAPLLKDFADRLADRMEEAEQEAGAAGADEKAVLKAIRKVATEESATMAATEGQATYGNAQLNVLRRAGYVSKRWQTCEDDRVRHTHEDCQLDGEIPMDATFSNGLLYPGQEGAPPSEVCNCRCWLLGGRKATA